MSTVEKLENNMAKITVEVDAARFEEGMKYSYNKNKSKINIQGFRKGKAPRKIIEMQYGPEVFYDDAINFVIPEAYANAVKENDVNVISKPDIEVTKVDKESGIVFTAEVAVKPEVIVGEYKGVKVEKVNAEVTDEDIQKEIEKVQEKNSRLIAVSDRPSQNGDTVTIDFEGFVDGVAFEGGKGEDYDLVLGSHSFIDNFEDQLVGKALADDVEVYVTFPEDYGKTELAGKPAMFKVEIKDIKVKELPELDDEFAKDVSEFDTLVEYKEDIKVKLKEDKEKAAKTEKESNVLKKIIENTELNLPKVVIDEQVEQMYEDYSKRISSQGLPFEMYLQYVGQTVEQFKAGLAGQAEFNTKVRYILEAIALKENIEVSDEEINEEIDKIAQAYKMDAAKLKEVMRDEEKQSVKLDVQVQKALTLVVDSAVEE